MPHLASRVPLRVGSLLLIGAMTSGCYTTTLISPTQAPRLAVNAPFAPGEDRTVRDLRGEVVTLGESFSATIDTRADLPPEWAQWSANDAKIHSPFTAEIQGPMLVLQPLQQPPKAVPLGYVKQIRVREYSHGKTAALAIGITAGAVLTVLGGLLIVVSQSPVQSSGGIE